MAKADRLSSDGGWPSAQIRLEPELPKLYVGVTDPDDEATEFLCLAWLLYLGSRRLESRIPK